MNFQNLMGGDCGDVNSLAQFAQHVVQDVARQDSVGQPSTSSGSASHSFTPPQSFRMRDLMNEMGATQPQSSYLPAITPSPDSQRTTEYQESRHFSNMMFSGNQSLWNIGLPSPQEVFLPSYPPYNFQPQLENNSEYRDNKYEVTVDSLDQLNYIYQREEQNNRPVESTVKQDAEPKLVSQKSWRGIPIYDDNKLSDILKNKTETYAFESMLKDYGEICSYEEWKLKNPNQECSTSEEVDKDKLLLSKTRHVLKGEPKPKEFSHIKNNSMKDCDFPFRKSKIELSEGNVVNAVLYADEAARQNPENVNRWLHLQYLYDKIKVKSDKKYSVAQKILHLDPTHNFSNAKVICNDFRNFRYYSAFMVMLNWLQTHKSYGDISVNFTIEENSSELDGDAQTWIDSNQHIIVGVKNMLLTAARRNPINVDLNVQLFLSYVLNFTQEYTKCSDCLTTIANFIPQDRRTSYLSYIAGLSVFRSGEPHRALNDFLIDAEKSENDHKVITCELIGIIYWYLTNYREAIRYFKKALEIDPSDEEFSLSNRGDHTLEAENELCLLLYSKLYYKNYFLK